MIEKSFQFNAFLRAMFLIFSAALDTLIIGTAACAVCFLDSYVRWFSTFQHHWSNWLLRANSIRLKLKGLENLQAGQAYILISNHASLLDIPAIISALPFPIRFIAKKSLGCFPLFGWSLYRSGHILIDRENAQSALMSLKKSASLLESGISILVFPEGTRTPDSQVKEFKRGAFLLALKAQAPIVPISISGTYQMLPRTGWRLWPGTIEIHIAQPIATRGLPLREAHSLTKRVRNMIIQNLNPALNKP